MICLYTDGNDPEWKFKDVGIGVPNPLVGENRRDL